jgi:C-terminal processing protease CtpA/Prc
MRKSSLPAVGYIRIGAFEDELPQHLEHALKDFLQIGARNVMVDLRATSMRGPWHLRSEVSGCFLPEGTQVFQIRDAKQAPNL